MDLNLTPTEQSSFLLCQLLSACQKDDSYCWK